jgi:hypothetical protein
LTFAKEKSKTKALSLISSLLTGVPEPALSEPAQQLIGVRSGGERGYNRTTTPRSREIRSRIR